MRPSIQTNTPSNTSNTGFATGLTGVGPFTTFSAATDGAHLVALTSAANLSAITMTIVGTDADGRSITEARAGPNVNTVLTAASFKTITSITASGTLGVNTMDVGWQDDFFGAMYPCDYRAQTGLNMTVVPSGTVNFTVQETFANVLDGTVAVWNSISALTSKTATTTATGSPGATAVRVFTNSYTNGATLKLFTDQATPNV